MPVYPDPNGGSMTVANQAEALARGWTPSMGTFGANSDPSGGSTGGASPTGAQQGFNQQAAQAAAQVADNAAQQAYLRARLNLDSDIEAHAQAQREWQRTFDQQRQQFQQSIDTANVTGYYNAPGTSNQYQEGQFVKLSNGPDIGQIRNGKLTPIPSWDQYLAAGGSADASKLTQVDPGTWQNLQTAGAAAAVGQGTPTLARESEQNRTSLGYLGLISQLQGPADYGKYLRTLASTPDGLRSLVSSAAGQYRPGGGTTGVAPQAASLSTLAGSAGAGAAGGAGGTTYDQYMQAAAGLPAPNQIAPQSFNAYTTSQKQALIGMYGQQGWLPQDVSDLYQQSLPKYAYNPQTIGSVKL